MDINSAFGAEALAQRSNDGITSGYRHALVGRSYVEVPF